MSQQDKQADTISCLQPRLTALQARIAELACRRPGGGEVRLIAVSKTRPPEIMHEAYRAGIRLFGENRIQELTAKVPAMPADVEWHFIGHLQRNKARSAVGLADWIHAVDSLDLLHRIDRIAEDEGRSPRILLQVNISGEGSKSGVAPDACEELAAAARECRHLHCMGLMTMAPWSAGKEELHDIFGRLRHLRDRLEKELRMALPELSMGMSNDYEIAIAEGATMVRIGSAIFEPLPAK